MKKIAIFLFLLALAPGLGLAATTIDKDNPAQLGTETFRVSNNVQVSVVSTSAAYAATSGHLQGNTQYGTTSLQNKVFEGVKTAGSFEDFSEPTDEETLDSEVFLEFATDATSGS